MVPLVHTAVISLGFVIAFLGEMANCWESDASFSGEWLGNVFFNVHGVFYVHIILHICTV